MAYLDAEEALEVTCKAAREVDSLLCFLEGQMNPDDPNSVYVGVDGGGTGTKVAIINGKGYQLACAIGEGCNKNNVGIDHASTNMFTTINRALATAKRHINNIRGICLALAGCDRSADELLWHTTISAYLDQKSKSGDADDVKTNDNSGSSADKKKNSDNVWIEIHNDSVGPLASVRPYDMEGIVIICGTGFIVSGYKDGDLDKNYRAGGWGPLLGDPCGGYAIGQATLQAAAYHFDGGEKTVLFDKVMKQCKLTEFSDVIGWAYHSKNSSARIAALAQLCLESYNECNVAQRIVDESVLELVNRVILVLNRMYPTAKSAPSGGITLVCSGSLFTKSELILSLFKKVLNWELGSDSRQVAMTYERPVKTSEYGAAVYVRNQCCGLFKY